jgi:hypothetical protein
MTALLDDQLRRLTILEDREAIAALMVEYNRACDAPADRGARIAACFTESGSWASVGAHGNPDWAATGHAALVRKFDRNIERMPFSAHFLTNGTINLRYNPEQHSDADQRISPEQHNSPDQRSDHADGSWLYFQTATYRSGQALWIAGAYEVSFHREGDSWLIQHLAVNNFFTTPYEAGWALMPHFETP